MESYNTNIESCSYENDEQYRKCLRSIFNMKENIQNELDIDEVSLDELNYDCGAAEKSMDFIFDKTKNNILFQKLYDCAAAKMLSTNRSIGLAVLFSYDNLKNFHLCICDFMKHPDRFNEKSTSYIDMYNTIK